jgi:hypothetical protein
MWDGLANAHPLDAKCCWVTARLLPSGHLEKYRSPVAAPSESHVLARIELSLSPRIWRFFEVPRGALLIFLLVA